MSRVDFSASEGDIIANRGTDIRVGFPITRVVDEVESVIDITNHIMTFTAWDCYGGEVTIAEKKKLAGSWTETGDDPENGLGTFLIEKTDLLPTGELGARWWYEVRRFDGAIQRVPWRGHLIIEGTMSDAI